MRKHLAIKLILILSVCCVFCCVASLHCRWSGWSYSDTSLMLWFSALHAACDITSHCCHGNRLLLTCGYDVYVKRERFGIYKCMCMWFVLHKWRGLRNTVIKQPLPPWTCPLMTPLAPPPPACIAPKDLSFYRRRLIYSLSLLFHIQSIFTFTRSRETANKCISSINVTRVF